MKIGILADTTCDLSNEFVQEKGIDLIPLSIHLNDQTYLDREEITSKEFFTKLEKAEQLPTTSQPSVGLFVEHYQKMAEKYDQIISMHISSKLSGTVESALLAAKQVENVDIKVIDSFSTSIGLGFLVQYAQRLIQNETDLDTIVDKINKAKENLIIYFTVDDLTYLEKGGRIGKAQALLGSILNICPLLYLPAAQGEILPLEKVRGKKKVEKRMVNLTLDYLQGEKEAWIGFLHGQKQEQVAGIESKVKAELANNTELNCKYDKTYISPIIGSHVGPLVYGIAIFKGDYLKNEG